ncbi:MAG: phage/plasmid primase, P4 family [Eubacterium sp.]
MELFDGYVLTKNKKCIEKIKGRSDFKNYEEVKDSPEFAGILGKETILIDVDEELLANILYKIVTDLDLKCRVYQTNRGKHFLFKNDGVVSNKTHVNLGIGIPADIKLGTRNSYEVLKFDGKEREILRDSDEIQKVPKWLFPVPKNADFLNLSAGDGRNQTLFNYILTLQSHDFNQDEARECIRIINDYVLKNPLPKSELETVLRDEAFQKPTFFNGTTFLFDKFGDYFKNVHHVIKINKQLHIYKDGIYIGEAERIENAMIKCISHLNRSKRAEVTSYLNIKIEDERKIQNASLIAFRNGVYDLASGELKPFSPDYIITNKINWDYNENAYSELVDKTLNKLACNDDQIRALLEEVIGYCFFRRNELGKAFILIGDKSNGKSTFLDMVRTTLGEDNISSLDLKELNGRFSTVMMVNKLANIGDDIDDNWISDSSIFKKIVTGDRISCEQKGVPKFEFNPYCKLLFSANEIPRMRDKTGAIMRRLIIIPFNATFSKDDPEFHPYIKHDLRKQSCIEYLIRISIEGLKRILKNKTFTKSNKVEQELAEYDYVNNPIIGFVQDLEENKLENEPTSKLYEEYISYCIRNGLQSLSQMQFSKDICKKYHYVTEQRRVAGKRYQFFVPAKK